MITLNKNIEGLFLYKDLEDFNFVEIVYETYDILIITDSRGRFVFCSKSMLNELVLNEDELKNKTVYDLTEKGYYTYSTVVEAMETKKVVTRLIKVYDNGIDRYYLSTSKPIFDDDGNLKYVVTNTRNEGILDSYKKELDDKRNEKSSNNYDEPIANSKDMKRLLHYCKNLAKSDSIVLITGESGVGKEVVSKYIHKNSNRANGPFVPINCAAIPSELVESELFGYKRGAFTGADPSGSVGLFEIANGGTLFLDEVGELPLSTQTKLLRVLDTNEVKKVGDTEYKKVNVRIIAATNRNLKQMVKEKKFREDLYYRLNVIPIEIPPLRNRKDDIIPLAEMYIEKFNKKYGTNKYLSDLTKESFYNYSWPGNIRELQNVVERFVITCQENEINESLEGVKPLNPIIDEFKPDNQKVIYNSANLKEAVTEYELNYIKSALEYCNGNVTQAADMLGIHRTHLYKKLK